MNKFTFRTGLNKYLLFFVPSLLTIGVVLYLKDWRFLGSIFLILFLLFFFELVLNFFKLQKLKKFCKKVEDGVYEISFSEIKEIIPINIFNYEIRTYKGNFKIAKGIIRNYENIENQVFRKLEEEPFLKIESLINFSGLFLLFAFRIKLIPVLFYDKNITHLFSFSNASLLIFGSYQLGADLIFKFKTNSFFKNHIKISKKDIISYDKSTGVIKMNHPKTRLKIRSYFIHITRIESYLEKHGFSNQKANKIPPKRIFENASKIDSDTYRSYVIQLIVFLLLFFSLMMLVTYYHQ